MLKPRGFRESNCQGSSTQASEPEGMAWVMVAMAWVMVASGVWESPAPHKSKGSSYLGRSFSFLRMHFGLSGSPCPSKI